MCPAFCFEGTVSAGCEVLLCQTVVYLTTVWIGAAIMCECGHKRERDYWSIEMQGLPSIK